MMSNSTGIICQNSASPFITNCSIKECARHGIEIASNSSPSMENTVIAMNGGDGVHIAAGCRPNLNHVTIGHNISAGVRSEDSNIPLIKNSIIWENSPDLINCHATGSCVGDGDDYPGNST
jgi:parallel beta-helix repeat protein